MKVYRKNDIYEAWQWNPGIKNDIPLVIFNKYKRIEIKKVINRPSFLSPSFSPISEILLFIDKEGHSVEVYPGEWVIYNEIVGIKFLSNSDFHWMYINTKA